MDMSMSMSMAPTSTMSGMSMTSSTSSSTPMSGMMVMDSMAMTFFVSATTPLYSMAWMPSSTGQYAGTCIFLIIFAAIFRALLAIRAQFWTLLATINTRRYGGLQYEAYGSKHLQRQWRAGEAVLLGAMDVVLAGVGYLLMIAVMTMNVGYFMSVLAGIFVGSVVFGRFISNTTAH